MPDLESIEFIIAVAVLAYLGLYAAWVAAQKWALNRQGPDRKFNDMLISALLLGPLTGRPQSHHLAEQAKAQQLLVARLLFWFHISGAGPLERALSSEPTKKEIRRAIEEHCTEVFPDRQNTDGAEIMPLLVALIALLPNHREDW